MTFDEQERARRWGASAYDGARERSTGLGFVVLEMAFIGAGVGVYAALGMDMSTPTAIGIALVVFIIGGVLSQLPVIGALIGLVLAAGWGLLAGAIATALGNQFLGIVVGIVVGLVVAGLHLGARR